MSAGNTGARLRWLIGLIALGLFAYAIAVVAIGASIVPGKSSAERRVQQYTQLERDVDRAVIAFLTVDYTRIDKLTEAVKDRATGAFLQEYEANEVNLKAAATSAKAQTTGEVKSIGIQELHDDTAVAFVAADSVVKNATTAKVKKTEACPHDGKVCRYYRFKLTMSETDGEWKIAKLEFVS